jgi:4-hydroxybenzoate polyprenyltransferase
MNKINNYLSLIKFSHTIFAMPFALLGFFMGIFHLENTSDSWEVLKNYFGANYTVFVFIILCMVFARSAAMAFNRYLDRDFDAKNPRTAVREIPSGIITAKNALKFTLINITLFIVSAYMINMTCFLLSPIALLVILGYSYTKRFTSLCHLVLGLGLALAPAGAFIAVTATMIPSVFFLSLAVVGWVAGFDIIYSLQDDQFDASQGLFSIPSRLGRQRALAVSRILHLLTSMLIVAAGIQFNFHFLYAVGGALFIGLLIFQQSLVKANDLSRVNIAFMTANGIASIVFSIFAITDLIIN